MVARLALSLALYAPLAQAITPIEKVTQLLEDLKGEVEAAGTKEAGTYDTFACFCKDTTGEKSSAITNGHDGIDQLAAAIEEGVATKAEKATDLMTRRKKQEEDGAELEQTTTRCQTEALEHEANIADLGKAVGSLDKAITALKGSKPSFLQRDALQSTLQQASESLNLAEILGLARGIAKKELPTAQAFLQQRVNPDDPTYKFHSSGIISTLDTMKTEFTTKKTEKEAERDSAKTSCDKLKSSLTTQMEANDNAMGALKTDISGLEESIGGDREALTSAESTLKDDQLYLKELTQRCEKGARDWDQRATGRADELQALTQALVILKDGKDGKKSVTELDAVNKRSFLIQPVHAKVTPASVSLKHKVVAHIAAAAGGPSFLQAASGVRGERHTQGEQVTENAVEYMRQEGIRLKSEVLSAMSMKIASNPFDKVKGLIQKLIERLLREANEEATKKGFCDTEVGKAKQDRKHRNAELKKLTAQLHGLEAKKGELNQSVIELNDAIPGLYDTLNQTVTQRSAEKVDNVEAIKQSKEGVAAVAEAITVLKVYYKKAAMAFLQASPVDADTEGPGFSGAYKGSQAGAKGIIGMLEVIKADFDRTNRQTTQAEEEAHEEFVEFERTTKSDIAAKETSLELNTQELQMTTNKIDKKMGDLTTAQSLLDDALKVLEDLKPMCIDTSMSYAERSAQRDAEIEALHNALCILDPNGVEAECGGGQSLG